jgi:PAS domain S-box-containing protein
MSGVEKNNVKRISKIAETQNLLNALHQINLEFIDSSSDKRSLFKKMLLNVLSLTQSEYGFIGEILFRDGQPYLKTYAITDISWDEATAALYKKYETLGMEFTNLNTLFGHTIKTGEVVISNNPSKDTLRGGLPKGHPALNHYLGIPVKDKSNAMIGMIGIANKKGGYSDVDVEYLSPLISLTSAYISAIRAYEAKDFFSDTLELYKNAIDNHTIVSVTDVEGTITYVNDKFCKISEFSTSEIIGKKHNIINSGFHEESFYKNLWETLLDGKIWKGEFRNRSKTGKYFWVSATIVPFLDENKNPYQFLAFENDVTMLKEQERELLNFFRLSVDMLCITTLDARFVKFSESFPASLGWTEQELTDKPILELIHPEDLDQTKIQLKKLSEGQKVIGFENRCLKKDGTYMLLTWKASLNQEDGLIYAHATDITHKHEFENQIIQAKVDLEKAKTKDYFLANMSHEIRTPLNAIIGFTELLSRTNLDQEQSNYLEIIESALKNLNVIVNDILDLSKLESGKVELEYQPFLMEVLLKQIVQMNLNKAKSKNVKLLFSYDSGIPECLLGDETRISQILINLVSNAIKFTNEGYVELRVTELSRENDQVKINFSVRDTGIGIDREKMGLIFERFTQAEESTTRLYGGTGLGLSIVKSLIKLHKGELKVESSPGIGSDFSFDLYFSISNVKPEKITTKVNTYSKINNLKGLSILIIEDNEHNQILARNYLEINGAKVVIAGNGKLGIEALNIGNFDLILMDIQMPVMDGIETTLAIRQELNLNIPIVGCSAHALESERKKCLNAGMNAYITKPYKEKELINVIMSCNLSNEVDKNSYIIKSEIELELENDDAKSIFRQWESEYDAEIVDELLAPLKRRIPLDIEKFNQYMESGENSQIFSLAHNLKGSLTMLRFTKGARLLKELETTSKSGNSDLTNLTCTKIILYLENLLTEINNI